MLGSGKRSPPPRIKSVETWPNEKKYSGSLVRGYSSLISSNTEIADFVLLFNFCESSFEDKSVEILCNEKKRQVR